MHKGLILGFVHALRGQLVALLVLPGQIPPEEENVNDEEGVAAQMSGKGDEVPGGVFAEEDLGAWWVEVWLVLVSGKSGWLTE